MNREHNSISETKDEQQEKLKQAMFREKKPLKEPQRITRFQLHR